jgi:Abnormal spindle-like microcephaly-assoc'd, ASPM-SPD-2-Hydin
MSRFCHALILVAVALLIGCGGGASSPNNSHGTTPAGTLSVSTPSIAFGNVALGSSATQTRQLAAINSAVTISSGSWSGDGFSVSGITFPVTVMAGHSVPFTITFAPQAAGSTSGTISFLSDAANSPTSETFTGTGSQPSTPPSNPPSAHSVSLFWSPSPSAVIGYNVYRGTTSGGPYPSKLTSSPQPTTGLIDNTVMAGTTYYYVATSVDENDVESIFSNQLTATVP